MRRADLVSIVASVVILGAPAVALCFGSQEGDPRLKCASNIRTLWLCCFNYAAQYGRPNGLMPLETGSDFWLKLKKTPKPLLSKPDPLFCPLADHDWTVDQTSYRGPAVNVNKMEDTDPVGADFDGNHGAGKGGNVLIRTGDVRHYAADDPGWKAAAEKTTGKAPVKRKEPATTAELEKRIEALEKTVKELTELVRQLKEKLEKEGK
jgi:hypothetical protein